ncbi:MAG TPA: M15 family metallopeptidase [Steroidobacteraceae bacterium]|nr:M15 family metallopeptidase [Steroidobacteraceae bacterium]
MNAAELTGRARTHIAAIADPECLLHARAVKPFLNLRRAAQSDGIDLAPASSFRDFARQLAIWNGKFSGERPMYDASGVKLDPEALAPRERVEAILQWSALPGASRHHWGTDLDLIDRRATTAGYEIKLTPEEFAAGGPLARLDQWLEAHAPRFGFFRPFRGVRSGVQAEPWHLSFAPVAEQARRDLSPQLLRAAIAGAPLMGKDAVLERLDELHARYVAAIDLP